MPKRIIIIGGGYIACEFAGIFNGFGVRVTQLYRGEQILRGFDHDIRSHLAGELVKSGIDLRLKTDVARLEKQGNALLVHLTDGSTMEVRSEEHTSELQSLMRISYAVFCLKKKK